MRSLIILTVVMSAQLVPSTLRGDDLTGAEQLLCASVQATVCETEGECESGAPWTWNVPQFIEIDLGERVLRTTEASGEARETPIKNFLIEEGTIFLQGVERGRAFSVVIEESSGSASIAVARSGLTVSVFGACTPIPESR